MAERSGSGYPEVIGDRAPLEGATLGLDRLPAGGLWTALEYRASTGSTNADVAAAARAGAAEGYVVVADEQTDGRGRLDRAWRSPPRSGLAVSVLLRPGVARRGWPAVPISGYGVVPLLAGVALVETVRRLGQVDAVLKWPNDLLVDGRKCAGILAETVPGSPAPAVVVGIGLNVTLSEAELPTPEATSLSLVSPSGVDRDALLDGLLAELAGWYERWRAVGGDATRCGLLDTYRVHCATIGATVRIAWPGGGELVGVATSVERDGSLRVGDREVPAGDVVHLRG